MKENIVGMSVNKNKDFATFVDLNFCAAGKNTKLQPTVATELLAEKEITSVLSNLALTKKVFEIQSLQIFLVNIIDIT